MKIMKFADAIEDAIRQAMEEDDSVFLMGEDVKGLHLGLHTQFGDNRIRSTPISEAAFLGAGVTAAMDGLQPIVEVMLVDFLGVAADGILNHVSKNYFFSGNKWNVPLVIKSSCGGGYGDAGQHEQSLWGWFAHIPGLSVLVPSNPSDAGTLMYSAIKHQHPVLFLEHKLLAENWLEWMGRGGRKTISFDIPKNGAEGSVPPKWIEEELGKARTVSTGSDITIISLGVSLHRCIEALEKADISADVIDLRSVSPLDWKTISESVKKTGKVIVVDEDYKEFGLSGEIAAGLLERDINFQFKRVCTEGIIPYNRILEDNILPNVNRIIGAIQEING